MNIGMAHTTVPLLDMDISQIHKLLKGWHMKMGR